MLTATTAYKKPLLITETTPVKSRTTLTILFLLCFPLGVYYIWKRRTATWKKVLYTVAGIPLFLFVYSFLFITLFAAFLPPLDRSTGIRADRTINNMEGQYDVTFLKTARETNGAYEMVQVTLQPGGGNDWHYHKAFVEQFNVLQVQLKVGLNGQEISVEGGQHAEAPKKAMHKFYNTSNSPVVFNVTIVPARSFEKTLRVAYGLISTGQTDKNGLPKNPWHLFLLLGYSESYLQGLPGFIQEPLINALAKIAQWKGEDEALKVFYQ